MVTAHDTGSKSAIFQKMDEDYLDNFGTTITLVKITETRDSMERVTATSEATSTIKCDIQWVNKKDLEYLQMGEAQVGDGMIFVLHNADINLEDEIIYDGERWKITSQVEGELLEGNVTYKAYIIKKKA